MFLVLGLDRDTVQGGEGDTIVRTGLSHPLVSPESPPTSAFFLPLLTCPYILYPDRPEKTLGDNGPYLHLSKLIPNFDLPRMTHNHGSTITPIINLPKMAPNLDLSKSTLSTQAVSLEHSIHAPPFSFPQLRRMYFFSFSLQVYFPPKHK